jgi:hypothetical protein
MYSPPFVILHRSFKHEEDKQMKLDDVMQEMGIPHQSELLSFYENYLQGRFSSN